MAETSLTAKDIFNQVSSAKDLATLRDDHTRTVMSALVFGRLSPAQRENYLDNWLVIDQLLDQLQQYRLQIEPRARN